LKFPAVVQKTANKSKELLFYATPCTAVMLLSICSGIIMLHTSKIIVRLFLAWNVALQCQDSYDVMRQLFVLCHDVSNALYFEQFSLLSLAVLG